ncbi:MAG: SDR family NAD(P)-dependent oxidoreductase [Deltaproteobacteria bacterium]|nr:SDR family NAD(P)-dependent oxidoreductase [Deltaproteobacteria bacterium]
MCELPSKDDRAEQIVEAITSAGGKAITVRAGVSVESDVVRLFSTCDDQLGPVTVLVNNAGIIGDKTSTDQVTFGNMARILAVNVTGSLEIKGQV